MKNFWRQTGLKIFLPVTLLTLMTCASAFSKAEEHQTTEYKIKAAFLYNFSRFVTWPDHARWDEGKFNLCILGDDPFGDLLDAIAGKSVQNTSLEIKRLDRVNQESACQIIFISESGASELSHRMSVLKDKPILTVSDVDGFTDNGGIIQFKLVDNKLQFNINIDAASRAGLKISSKLLSLATVVRNDQ